MPEKLNDLEARFLRNLCVVHLHQARVLMHYNSVFYCMTCIARLYIFCYFKNICLKDQKVFPNR